MNKIAELEIIVGTYEEYLLGYKYNPKSKEIKQTFAIHSHSSSIRSVCTSGNYLASGGADDRIFIYDLKNRKEHCVLTQHNATVNCIDFTPEHTHVISGSADGTLAVVRVGNWQLEKIWENAHKGSAILDIAVHSSGKLALTLGSDRTLYTWNLVKGRQAYIINLNNKSKDPKSLDCVRWAPCGVRFVLAGGKYTEIWSIEKGGILNAIEHSNKVTCCTWLSNNSLVVGYENGKLALVNTDNNKVTLCDGHNSRVKAVVGYEDFIITATSSGDVSIWDKSLNKLSECNSGCRITCLCIATCISQDVKKEEIKSEPEDESESESNDDQKDEEDESDEVEVIIPRKKVKTQKTHR
ncbi:hypothetical protein ILUMI_05213 [Ignelater luminosus]|uniref:P21-activated protein kinase-interacting protein 1-like n=1 Tax=Ignelater luminosus TaxID=2038154 RepID=A0A8K0DDC8_IGNLU|nr:hypothetical protein ILUMI_05213 [Ignelater luminosus]